MTVGVPFVDHYEALQISPNADPDTVHRVYRLLAQRFHPDRQESGDAEIFRSITEAYRVLSEPEKRAAYDVEYSGTRKLQWKIFDQSNSAHGVEAETRKRQGVLELLYRKRTCQPEQPALSIHDLQDLLSVPKEHLEFTLWYLKEGQFITRGDNGRYVITLKGVDLAESLIAKQPAVTPLAYLTSAAHVA